MYPDTLLSNTDERHIVAAADNKSVADTTGYAHHMEVVLMAVLARPTIDFDHHSQKYMICVTHPRRSLLRLGEVVSCAANNTVRKSHTLQEGQRPAGPVTDPAELPRFMGRGDHHDAAVQPAYNHG